MAQMARKLTLIPEKGAPVVHVALIVPVDSVIVVQVVLDASQVGSVIGAVDGVLLQTELTAVH